MEKSLKEHLFVLILCGGGGTRLWPRSLQKTPKQFLENLFGQTSLFAQTVERAQWLTSNEKIFVITLSDYVDEVLSQGKVILPRNVIAEPQGRNTALAMGVGAAYIKKIDPQAIIVNFASDQLIEGKELFVSQMSIATQAALQGNYLITVGIKPKFPHTGLGYIEAGEKMKQMPEGIFKVNSFKEKPELPMAKRFLETGRYYWNANLYVWSTEAIWLAFAKHAPKTFEFLKRVFENLGTKNEAKVLKEVYRKAENIQIDYAISEKADNLLLVPATFTWSDVGDWRVIYDFKKKDKQGNVMETFGKKGWCQAVDSKNCLVESQNRLVAIVGVSDLIVVETDDCVLVCSKEKAQDVKKIVTMLKEKGKEEYL